MRELAGRVDRLATTGEGIVRHEGLVVFVPGALPEEEISFRIVETKKRHARGILEDVIRASPDRQPESAHSAFCGGEDWSHVAPGAARRWKTELFAGALRRIGRIEPPPIRWADELSDRPGYRLRNQFHVGWRNGEAVAGFFQKRSHDVVSVEGCQLVSAETQAIVTEWASALPGGNVEQPLILLTAETVETGQAHRVAAVLGPLGEAVPGFPSRVEISICDLRFGLRADAFFQVNRDRVEPFFRSIERLIGEIAPADILEIGAGTGYLTCAAARSGASVVAVEPGSDPDRDLERNLGRAGIDGAVDVERSTIERFLESDAREFDLVLADPPRRGIGDPAAELARRARREFVYVSCDPVTLARDLRTILDQGFEIVDIVLEDFFPRTHRIESVVRLRRAA